jgi:HAD superfamily hydrolase (TIGR01549 family)
VIFDLDHTLVKCDIDFSEMKTQMLGYLEGNLKLPLGLGINRSTYEIISRTVEYLQENDRSDAVPGIIKEINRIMTDTEMKYVSKATLIEGATETLGKLKRAGLRIGILTRSCRDYTNQVLKSTGLSTLVDEVAARDDSDNPKPDPVQVYGLMEKMKVGSEEVVMVGDHPIDLICAKNAGIEFIGVLTGSWETGQRKQLGPVTIPSVKELPALLGL